MSIDTQTIFKTLEDKITGLAKTTLTQYADAAVCDGKNLLETIKDDLERWTQLLADKSITKDDFETLVLGDKDLVEMSALSQAGLTLARIDQFKGSVINLIIDTIFSCIGL